MHFDLTFPVSSWSDLSNFETMETESDQREDENASDFRRAYEKGLARISRREQSSLELRRYLLRKSFSEQSVDEAVRRLLDLGYLNDERYARALARSLLLRGKGPRYITQKLKEKGVSLKPDEIMSESESYTGMTDVERAREIVERRYPGFREDIKEANRAYQALVRRGFSFDVAKKAIRRSE